MNNSSGSMKADDHRALRLLTYMMFLIFAMTTDAVGVIIPEIIEQFDLSLTEASTFHYGTMIAIAVSALGLGFLADRFGRKRTIIGGLLIFAAACFLFPFGNSFYFFLMLLVASGFAIGIFKTAALALIGDISISTHEHTRTMNLVEGFFGIGAIIGPALVTYLLIRDVSWVYVYAVAGAAALVLIVVAYFTSYPATSNIVRDNITWKETRQMLADPYALGVSFAIGLYVVVEAGIYVWMPTLLKGYDGDLVWLATYALSVFFIFRAAGRFLGAWLLSLVRWQVALLICTALICACYLAASFGGVKMAVWALPLSGLFMSIIYPTLNSKGISCFDSTQHGAIAGVILFFTAVFAALGPLVMGLIGDAMGHVLYGFYFAGACAAALLLFSVYNLFKDPFEKRLAERI